MINSALRNLLMRNEVPEKELCQELYQTLLLQVFAIICVKMKDEKFHNKVLINLRKSSNEEAYVQNLVSETSGCNLSEEESSQFLNWIIAYFRKSNIRKKYPETMRIDLLQKQNHACKICNMKICLKTSELDHKIPWNYVGDELEDNLQFLCCSCNERKGKSIQFKLNMLLVNRKNVV